VTVPVEGGGRAEVVTDAHRRGEGAMAAVCAVSVEGDGAGGDGGGGASYGAVWGVGDEAAVCVGALQMLVAHVVGEGKALGEGVDAVVRLDGGEGGGGGELVVRELFWSKMGKWVNGEPITIKLQVSGRSSWLWCRSHHRIPCVCVQVDGRVGFEAAVSAATGELRAGVAGERGAAAGLRRAVAVLRGEVAGLDSREATATALAERDAARTALAAKAAELAALQQVVSDLRRDLAAAATEREELRRRAEEGRHGAVVADAIERKVATPLTTAAASAYLRACSFPAGSVPVGITWGINTVPADRLTASSVAGDAYAAHPGCRLLYPDGAVAGKNWFCTKSGWPAGEWVCVDLGGERSVVGALVQSHESPTASNEDNASWHRHKFQWSTDGAVWTDVDGERVWSRDGLQRKDVSACVFGAPVRCRYLRIVALSRSGVLRWEVVSLP
jgi:hypothetical protein